MNGNQGLSGSNGTAFFFKQETSPGKIGYNWGRLFCESASPSLEPEAPKDSPPKNPKMGPNMVFIQTHSDPLTCGVLSLCKPNRPVRDQWE